MALRPNCLAVAKEIHGRRRLDSAEGSAGNLRLGEYMANMQGPDLSPEYVPILVTL
jgi:hypothetical protein